MRLFAKVTSKVVVRTSIPQVDRLHQRCVYQSFQPVQTAFEKAL